MNEMADHADAPRQAQSDGRAGRGSAGGCGLSAADRRGAPRTMMGEPIAVVLADRLLLDAIEAQKPVCEDGEVRDR